MQKIGLFLIVLGVGSFVLPLMGIQFRLIQAFGETPAVGAAFVGVGSLLYFIGWIVGRGSTAATPPGAAHAPALPRASGRPIPIDPAVASTPHPGGQPMPQPPPIAEDRFGQRCPRCGSPESIYARFCGSCGQTLAGAAPMSPVPTRPKSSAAMWLMIIAVIALGGAGWWVWKHRAPVPAAVPTPVETDRTPRDAPPTALPVPQPGR